jgi:hypothetical protein
LRPRCVCSIGPSVFEDMKELLNEASGPGDMATVLVAGTAGFLVDALLSAHGVLSPGQVGVSAAAGALGLKKSLQAALLTRGHRVAHGDPAAKAAKLRALLEARRYTDLLQRLDLQIELRQQDLIDDPSFSEALKGIIDEVQERRPPAVEPLT